MLQDRCKVLGNKASGRVQTIAHRAAGVAARAAYAELVVSDACGTIIRVVVGILRWAANAVAQNITTDSRWADPNAARDLISEAPALSDRAVVSKQ
jgi:hypothetical protein